MHSLSIIIVNYNTGEVITQCLASVYSQTLGVDFDIWVVDNGSVDGSPDEIERSFPAVNVIRNSENMGFARANNLGIRASKGEYVFLLNPDTILLNNAVGILLDFMEHDTAGRVGCCGGSLYNEDMTPQIAYGNFPSLAEAAFQVFKLKKVFRRYYREKLRSSTENERGDTRKVDYIVGADMFLRRSALHRTGLFDEDFFLYFEDTELGYRLKRYGFHSVIVPEARIVHLVARASSRNTRIEKILWREKSRFLFFRKCHGNTTARLVKTLYILKEARRFLTGFRKRNWEMIKIIAKA